MLAIYRLLFGYAYSASGSIFVIGAIFILYIFLFYSYPTKTYIFNIFMMFIIALVGSH
jgi:hypothetical protein